MCINPQNDYVIYIYTVYLYRVWAHLQWKLRRARRPDQVVHGAPADGHRYDHIPAHGTVRPHPVA
jgi:hypothetical protein